MSSIIRTGGSNIDRSAELRGLSTDTKPTRANGNEVPHGSTWYNMDDSTKYMYNADNDTWYNIPNGGGGGTGDMQKSVYDPTNTVANAGGIDTYVETEIGDAKEEVINEVNGNIAVTANNLIKDTVGWNNKNLLPITLSSLQEINTNGTWDDNVYTYRNITITVETDIYNLITDIKVNGANTAGSVAFKLTNNFVYQLLSEDKYYISDGVDVTAIVDGSAYISVERKKGESGETHYLSTNNENRSTKFTVDYATYDYYAISIYIPNNSSINNAIFYPMIRRASISDATYEPYRSTVEDELNSIDSAIGTLNANLGIANSRITNLQNNKANISDLGTSAYKNSTSVVTQSTDLVESGAVKDIVGWENKNYFTTEGITTAYYLNQNGTTKSSINWRITDYIDISDLSNIELKGIGANGNTPSLCFYDSNKVYISGVQYRNRTDIITVKPSNAVYIRVSVFVDDMETIILTHASVDETKCDNSVIGTVENGTNPTKSYAVGEHMVRGGKFCTVTSPVTTSSTWVEGSNYTSGDVTSELFNKGVISSGDDLDNIITTGIYFITDSPANVPENMSYCSLIVHKATNNATVRQMIFRNTAIYCRRKGGNPIAWSPWYKFEGTIVS